jgi:hypothetical protein
MGSWTWAVLACAVATAAQSAPPELRPGDAAVAMPQGRERDVAAMLLRARDAAESIRFPIDQMLAFIAIADVQRKAGDVDAAKVSLQHARRAIDAHNDRWIDCQYYCELAAAHLRTRDKPGALAVLDVAADWARKSPDSMRPFYLGWTARMRAWSDDREGAAMLFDEAIAGAKAGHPIRVQSDQATIAGFMADCGHADAALHVASKLTEEVWRRSAYVGIARGQAYYGDLAGAQTTITTAEAAGVDDMDDARHDLAEQQLKTGDLKAAKAMAEQIRDGFYKSCVWKAIALELAKKGDVDGATQAAARMDYDGFVVEVNLALADARRRAKDVAGAGANVLVAAKAVANEQDPNSQAEAYASLGVAQAAAGDAAAARESFAKARAIVDKIDPMERASPKWGLMAKLARAQLQTGDVSAATATADAIDYEHDQAQVYQDIAREKVKSGKAVDGWIEKLPNPMVKAYAWVGAAQAAGEKK